MPPTATEPMLRGALAELVQFGVGVARALAKLAAVEEAATDALAEAAVEAARSVVIQPDDPEEARLAARRVDASDLFRDTSVARMTRIAEAFDRVSRAVRRTVALVRRLEDARPFPALAASEGRVVVPLRPDAEAGRQPRDTPPEGLDRVASDLAEEMDKPERFPDETGGRPVAEVLELICRDFGIAQPAPAPDPAIQQRAEQRRAEREALKAYDFDSPERQARIDEIAERLAWVEPSSLGRVPDD